MNTVIIIVEASATTASTTSKFIFSVLAATLVISRTGFEGIVTIDLDASIVAAYKKEGLVVGIDVLLY